MWIGSQQFYKRGCGEVVGKPVFHWKMTTTGNPPPLRPTKTNLRHFNNRCTGHGMGLRRRQLPENRGRVWNRSDRAIECAMCGKWERLPFWLYYSEVDRQAKLPWNAIRRLCRACMEIECAWD
jgi:hypothetical protein